MKRHFVIICLVLILLGLAGSSWAYTTIIKDYPELPACKDNKECRPGQGDFGLPEYVKYIFIFSLGAVGIISMLALILAAFSYVMSAGNPQKAADAKDQIVSALLGLLLLLASWVLLNFINPDLLKLGLNVKPIIKDGGGGTNGGNGKIINYMCLPYDTRGCPEKYSRIFGYDKKSDCLVACEKDAAATQAASWECVENYYLQQGWQSRCCYPKIEDCLKNPN